MSNSDPSTIVLQGIPGMGGIIQVSIRMEKTVRSSFAAIHTKARSQVPLRVPDLQYDLAGFVGCARKHALRLTRLRKQQD